jgi:hypothetical protein
LPVWNSLARALCPTSSIPEGSEGVAAGSIVPVASCLYLVDGSLGYPGGKTDLMGIFNTLRAASFPHVERQFVVYARLTQGLGSVQFHIDIREASTQQLIRTTARNTLRFAHRDQTVEMAMTLVSVRFPRAGTYLVELWCNAQWVGDARLQVF